MLQAKDVMTSQVIAAGADASVSDVARLLASHGISAVPIVDKGTLIGIVSEGDLLRRAEIGTAVPHRSWWLRLFTDNADLASDYTKSHSVRVTDVMTRSVATVTEDTPLAEVADLLEKKRIKRVPVVRAGKVVGIVSRANLIRAIATAKRTPLEKMSRDDGTIRSTLLEALRSEPWTSVGSSDVTVTDGVVEFWGVYHSEAEREASHVLAANVAGVRGVEDHRIPVQIAYSVS